MKHSPNTGRRPSNLGLRLASHLLDVRVILIVLSVLAGVLQAWAS